MPLTNLNIGAAPNDGTGETLRSGGAKINTNYTFTVTTDTGQTISGAKTFTSPIGAADGAAATPSVTFASDLDTGMYRPAADRVAFSTNGAERLRLLDATQPVSSDRLFAVIGHPATANTNFGLSVGHDVTGLANSAAVSLNMFTNVGAGTAGGVKSGGLRLIARNNGDTGAFNVASINLSKVSGNNNGEITFVNAGTERMRIAADGNVGIGTGTSAPATLLHVNGTLRHGEQTQAVVSLVSGTRVDTISRTAVNFGGLGIMQSMFGDVPTVGEFYAYELGTTNRLLAVFYKTGTGSSAVVTVLASSVLTLGASNAGGTQVIDNATNNDNVRMIAIIRRVG
jgi:hypothetical protein